MTDTAQHMMCLGREIKNRKRGRERMDGKELHTHAHTHTHTHISLGFEGEEAIATCSALSEVGTFPTPLCPWKTGRPGNEARPQLRLL